MESFDCSGAAVIVYNNGFIKNYYKYTYLEMPDVEVDEERDLLFSDYEVIKVKSKHINTKPIKMCLFNSSLHTY